MASIFLDIGSAAVVSSTFIPAALTTTTYGTAVDLIDSNANMASAILTVGAVSGTQGTFDVKMQENTVTTATDAGWTDITGATFTQFTTSGVVATSGSQIKSFQRLKRYVRAYVTMAGTFTNGLFGVQIFAQRAQQPAANGGWVNETGGS